MTRRDAPAAGMRSRLGPAAGETVSGDAAEDAFGDVHAAPIPRRRKTRRW